MDPWKIIVVQPSKKVKTRNDELVDADARSHAARVSHSRKKRSVDADGRRRTTRQRQQQDTALPVPGPRTVLGQSGVDPFDGDNSRRLPLLMHEALEYAYETTWPSTFPTLKRPALTALRMAWRAAAVHSQLEFHCQVSNAATTAVVLADNPTVKDALIKVRLQHQIRAIEALRKVLTEPAWRATDELLMSVLRLTGQGGPTLEADFKQSFPAAPLSDAFSIKLYGRFVALRFHYDAAIFIVTAMGGVKNVHPAVVGILQMIDVGYATHLGEPPRVPWALEAPTIPVDPYDVQASALAENLGAGFKAPSLLSPEALLAPLEHVIEEACHLTMVIYQYQHAREPNMGRLLAIKDRALYFQHMLCSVPPQTPPDDHGNNEAVDHRTAAILRECVRLSLVCYSDLVLFPSAKTYILRTRVSNDLKTCLKKLEKKKRTRRREEEEAAATTRDDDNKIDCPELMIWMTVMGGVTSTSPQTRAWYCNRLRESMNAVSGGTSTSSTDDDRRNRDFMSLRDFTDMLKRHLYWDEILEGPTTALWSDATTEPILSQP
ncbi:hypothetical protein PV08_08438 [Exophiala spinifera]|uniref:Transcription factor domain-containing protein n=1 Tax=Exophiala spinifera TaxID=91928 RepID=A0A0D1YDV8_9EURO|nr:uncharacterized protein PV08_08438 [Exophiala spinifera]KIW13251.1 hypothetical protein PV08_08438 [Exophiala spinifera]